MVWEWHDDPVAIICSLIKVQRIIQFLHFRNQLLKSVFPVYIEDLLHSIAGTIEPFAGRQQPTDLLVIFPVGFLTGRGAVERVCCLFGAEDRRIGAAITHLGSWL